MTQNTRPCSGFWARLEVRLSVLSLAHPSTYLHKFKRVIRVPSVGVDLIVQHVAHIDETRGEREREREYRGRKSKRGKEMGEQEEGEGEGWSGGGRGQEKVRGDGKKENITEAKLISALFGGWTTNL